MKKQVSEWFDRLYYILVTGHTHTFLRCAYVYLFVFMTGEKLTHYYVKEGVGIAVGLFLSALTNIGLFTLTSTPLNAGGTICQLLSRPANEKVCWRMWCVAKGCDVSIFWLYVSIFLASITLLRLRHLYRTWPFLASATLLPHCMVLFFRSICWCQLVTQLKTPPCHTVCRVPQL